MRTHARAQGSLSITLKRLLTNLAAFDQSHATPLLDRAKLLSQYRKSKKRLFMFDYDGTLTPIVKEPQAAIPTDKVIRNLKQLAANPNNAVWIISGRDQSFLDEWMGHISELGLSAEHGSFMRLPHTTEWENLAEHYDMTWQKAVMKVFQHYTERTQGSFIERKKIALTWHYRKADHELGLYHAKECQKKLEQTVVKEFDVEVMPGKANLEVRPRFVNKGEIAKRLVNEYGAEEGQAPEFVLCLGDDFTDEGKLNMTIYPTNQNANSSRPRHVPLPPRLLATRRPRLRSDRRRQLQADHRLVAPARAFGRHLVPRAAQRQHRRRQRRRRHGRGRRHPGAQRVDTDRLLHASQKGKRRLWREGISPRWTTGFSSLTSYMVH